MKTRLLFSCTLVCGLFSQAALAASGETWELVTRTEMPGMAMPETTLTVCQPKGGAPDPQQMMQGQSQCMVSDVKRAGNKVTWKVHCDGDGQKMNGSGEITHGNSSYQGSMHMSGTADGQKVDMKASYTGKRLGAPCDPSAPPVMAVAGMENLNEMMGMAKAQMAAGMAEQCEVSRYEAAQLMSNQFFGPNAMCAQNQKYACKVISKDVMKKAEVYLALVKHDDTSDISIADACKIDMKAAQKAACKKVDGSNYQDFEDACPAEYAKFSALASSGRSYTSTPRSTSVITDNPVGGAIDNARKLKGLLGF